MKWPDDQDEIRKRFDSEGFVVVDQFWSEDVVAEVNQNLDRYMVDILPTIPRMDVFYQQKGIVQSIKMLSRMQNHDPFFNNMLRGTAQQLPVLFWSCRAVGKDTTYFGKPPAVGEPTPPHQDGYYFHLTPCEAVTMWIALEPVDQQNGCLRYVRGSHRRGMRPHARTKTLGFSQGITDYGQAGDMENEVSVCLNPGDLVVHDSLTIHRADANHHPTRSRKAMGLVYFSERARVDEEARQAYQDKLSNELAEAGRI